MLSIGGVVFAIFWWCSVIYGVYCMLSIDGVVFPIFWWCRVLSIVCTVCYLCCVVYLLRMGVYCFPSFGGVKCCLWCVKYVFYVV